MKISAKVTVRNRVARKLRGVRTKTDAATLRAADFIRDGYKERVKRDPNHDSGKEGVSVFDSIEIKKTETTGEQSLVVQVGSYGAHHGRPVAKWLENGTVKTNAQPALRPAANAGRRFLKKEQTDAVQEAAKDPNA